jgi:hypothetical protein
MDIVTDLTSQAVSYITLYQDISKNNIPDNQIAARYISLGITITCSASQLKRIKEIYILRTVFTDDELLGLFINRADVLFAWVTTKAKIIPASIKDHLFKSPSYWRSKIRLISYDSTDNRIALAEKLSYMPLQVILAMGGKKITVHNQPFYQLWGKTENPKPENASFVSLLIKKKHKTSDPFKPVDKWWNENYQGKPRQQLANELLKDNKALREKLVNEEIALPFETLFNEELAEIIKSREIRSKDIEEGMVKPNSSPVKEIPKASDPVMLAGMMKLKGLALSGGGIRSATFNLGLIQKLANLKELNSFDYISTVSGGGYIGSWLISWIQRTESITKVSNRLDPEKSVDPMADEVMPIRWLRMYSNYLSPNASIMSADAWTTGMTWLRNTLINQVTLLLLSCSVLSVIATAFQLWRYLEKTQNNFGDLRIGLWSFGILGFGAILTGLGMRSYVKKTDVPPKPLLSGKDISLALVCWGTIAGFLISSWFYADIYFNRSFKEYLYQLWPGAVAGFITMIAIAWIGRYVDYGNDEINKTKIRNKKNKIRAAIVSSSLIAAIAGWMALAGVWKLFGAIVNIHLYVNFFQEKLVFILGVPLILEAISISVVIRMAIMGRLFPDERREWWGRTGGIVHRLIFIWILVTTGALILPDEFRHIDYANIPKQLPVAFGSWAAIMWFAVKTAFGAGSDTKTSDKGNSKIADLFVRVAPYLFMLGFLLISAYTLDFIFASITKKEDTVLTLVRKYSEIAFILSAITWLISWRTGVNEFSLHHFYRNRLTRAYLGATRRRAERERTANSFTGFDTGDDLPMTAFLASKNYSGPYPILNTALNATDASELDRQDRKAESFIFSPLYCGFDFSATRSAANNETGLFNYGYRPTTGYSADGGPLLGSVMAMSGAAASPNMGYHSSPATAFLLTMFNVRLGRWIGNPRLSRWRHSEPTGGIGYLVKDLIGKTDIDNDYVCLSDGGHFDNMGIYELVRRRCSYILLADAEEDAKSSCEGLANAIRRCRIDFGVEIIIDTANITDKDKTTSFGLTHLATGTIIYPDVEEHGELIYVKTGLTKNETVDIREYFINNPSFPQQSTGDQFFDEAQFESYRKLGYQSIPDKTVGSAKQASNKIPSHVELGERLS